MPCSSGFGERLRVLRTERGMTAAALGAALGRTQGHITHWEHGRRQPRHDDLISTSRMFGVSTDYLLTGEVSEVADAKANAPSAVGLTIAPVSKRATRLELVRVKYGQALRMTPPAERAELLTEQLVKIGDLRVLITARNRLTLEIEDLILTTYGAPEC